MNRPIFDLQTLEPKRPRRHLEDQLQRQLISYWQRQYPATWALTTHIPSGMAALSPRHAAIIKSLGWKAGVPDLLCFARCGDYAGLALELKHGANRPTPAQAGWLTALEAEGWRVGVFNDLGAAGDFVDQYHALGRCASQLSQQSQQGAGEWQSTLGTVTPSVRRGKWGISSAPATSGRPTRSGTKRARSPAS